MKRTPYLLAGLLWTLTAAPWANAQFVSGSDGSLGAIEVTDADLTLDLPPDGILHCTTVQVAPRRTLTFRRNPLNTPVLLLATGDVTIAGAISVSGFQGTAIKGGEGGPGGFDGGAPGLAGQPAGDGQGPGGGKGGISLAGADGPGAAAYSTQPDFSPEAKRGAVYGSPLLQPMVGGSGGGGGGGGFSWGGGGGGGALLIASSTRITVNGTLLAVGGGGYNSSIPNSGSGGAVRLVAPVVAGTGSIEVGGYGGGASRGNGRARIDALDRTQLAIRTDPAAAVSVGGVLMVFPSPAPRLDIVEAAARPIAPDSGPVTLLLPSGTSPNQSIRIRARDFGQRVPLRVVLTPDSGPATPFDAEVDNSAPGSAEVLVPVVFPINQLTRVHVWTR